MTNGLYDGQHYELVRTEAYTRRDGSETTLSVWQSECPVCGEAFEVRTPARARKFEPNRRCGKHRRPGVRVNRPGEAEMRQGGGRLKRAVRRGARP
jgi:rRNA maturation protein Nop10